jgi:hypothetical protein
MEKNDEVMRFIKQDYETTIFSPVLYGYKIWHGRMD